MNPGEFFQTLTYILMGSAFITLLLIFLLMLRGREQEDAKTIK